MKIIKFSLPRFLLISVLFAGLTGIIFISKLVPSAHAQYTTIFESDFEGADDEWSGIIKTGGGTADLNCTAIPYTGSEHGQFNVSAGSNIAAYCHKTFNKPFNEMSVSAWFSFNRTTNWRYMIHLANATDAGIVDIQMGFNFWRIGYWNGSNPGTIPDVYHEIEPNKYYNLTLVSFINSSNGYHKFYINSTLVIDITDIDNSYNGNISRVNIGALPEGDYYNNQSINVDDVKIQVPTIFVTPPTINLLSPENKTYNSNLIPLTFEINKPTSWIGFSLDSESNTTVSGNTTINISEGPHQIMVFANDTFGNMGVSSMVFFTVDTTPPTVVVLSPENTTYVVDDVSLTFTVDEAVSWMSYSFDGLANVTIGGNTTLSDLPDGLHHVVVFANDTFGNMGVSSMVFFTVDTTPPNITLVSQTPLPNNVLPEDEVSVNATVIDILSGVRQVILSYTNGNGTWITINMTNSGGTIWQGTIPNFDYGTWVNYTITAEDQIGNMITSEEIYGYQYEYSVIPEFSSLFIMLLFLIALTATAFLFRKRTHE